MVTCFLDALLWVPEHIASLWHRFECYIHYYSGLGPFLGAILGATIAAAAGFLIARHYTGRMKVVDATLEFSRRYQELLERQHTLNKEYRVSRGHAVNRADAENWYRRYFDLLFNEVRFFQRGLAPRRDFAEWMRWACETYRKDEWSTCGTSYRRGWADWAYRPVNCESPYVKFLAAIHDVAEKYNGDTTEEEKRRWMQVRCIVRQNAPRGFWRRRSFSRQILAMTLPRDGYQPPSTNRSELT